MSNFHEDHGAVCRYVIYIGGYPDPAGNMRVDAVDPERIARRQVCLVGECIAKEAP